MTRVLVVEDEPQIVRALVINLRAATTRSTRRPTAPTALRLAAARHPDVVVLDLGLPDMDGVEVITRAARLDPGADPGAVRPARPDEKVEALDAGADDYVTKPFGMDELLARLRAAVRRAEPAPDDDDAVVRRRPRVHRRPGGKKVTPRRGATYGSPPPSGTCWRCCPQRGPAGQPEAAAPGGLGPRLRHESNYLRVYMAQLRRKLEPDPARPRHLSPNPAWATASSPSGVRTQAKGGRSWLISSRS